MRRSLGQELDDTSTEGQDEFESPNTEKGIELEGFPGGVVEDPTDKVWPTSKGNMVKESNYSNKDANNNKKKAAK